LIASVEVAKVMKATPEMNSAPSKESPPDPSRQSFTRDDRDTTPTPELSLRVGERLRFEEIETSEAWVEGDETRTVPKKIRLNRNPC
jgi:hypothetical protein